jgi:ubiquinone biosynthesis protein
MLKYIPESRFFDPVGIVDEFARSVRRELDFIAEAKNAQRFKRNFEGSEDVCIPAVFPDVLSHRVLVMERLEGIRIDDIDAMDERGMDRKEITRKGVDAYFRMIFEHGFFHADPHPGNIFVLQDGRIGIMDFGIVGWLTQEMVDDIAAAFLAIMKKDFDRLIEIYIDLGLITDKVNTEAFRKEFKADLVYLLEPLYDMTISEINFPEYLEALTHLIIKHGLTVPSDLMLMNKTILIVDSIGRLLDPDFNLVAAAEPYASELVRRRMSPRRVLDKSVANIEEIGDLIIDTPRQINRLLKKSLRDEMSFKIDPVGMDRLIRDIDRSSNRIAFSLVVASIIIGSSMLIQSDIGGRIFGLPTVGAIGFLVAFLLGLRLLISILRSGRL